MARRNYSKIKPSIPNRDFFWFGLMDDDCWYCKHRQCNNCVVAKWYVSKQKRKEVKRNRNIKNFLE